MQIVIQIEGGDIFGPTTVILSDQKREFVYLYGVYAFELIKEEERVVNTIEVKDKQTLLFLQDCRAFRVNNIISNPRRTFGWETVSDGKNPENGIIEMVVNVNNFEEYFPRENHEGDVVLA